MTHIRHNILKERRSKKGDRPVYTLSEDIPKSRKADIVSKRLTIRSRIEWLGLEGDCGAKKNKTNTRRPACNNYDGCRRCWIWFYTMYPQFTPDFLTDEVVGELAKRFFIRANIDVKTMPLDNVYCPKCWPNVAQANAIPATEISRDVGEHPKLAETMIIIGKYRCIKDICQHEFTSCFYFSYATLRLKRNRIYGRPPVKKEFNGTNECLSIRRGCSEPI